MKLAASWQRTRHHVPTTRRAAASRVRGESGAAAASLDLRKSLCRVPLLAMSATQDWK